MAPGQKSTRLWGEERALQISAKMGAFQGGIQKSTPLCSSGECYCWTHVAVHFFFAACNVCINQEAANRYNGDTMVLQTISMQQHQKIGCNNTNRATYQQSRTAQSVTMLL